MKNLLVKIFLGLFVLVGVSIFLGHNQTSYYTSDPKWNWIEDKVMAQDAKTYDYAIIGSSMSWCGIRPDVLSEKLGSVINLSRNWGGREADFVIARNLLRNHQVKNLILEFRSIEPLAIHPYSHHILSWTDFFSEFKLQASSLQLSKVLRFHRTLKEFIKNQLTLFSFLTIRPYLQWFRPEKRCQDSSKCPAYEKEKGFYHDDSGLTQNPKFVKDFAGKKLEKLQLSSGTFPLATRADFYLKKLAKLASVHKAKLYLVFVPQYFEALPSDEHLNYLRTLADVIILDQKDLFQMTYWRDRGHLYQNGSRYFSNQLLQYLTTRSVN